MNERASLRQESMALVWNAVRNRLESQGADNRGRVRLPELSSPAKLVLRGLLGHDARAMLDLAAVERALVALEVGDDLAGALDHLGFTISPVPAARRAARAVRTDAHSAARAAVADWQEEWAPDWITGVIRAGILRGLDADGAAHLVTSTRRVIDRIAETTASGDPISRTDLAAIVLGDSHALDEGAAIEAACARALRHAAEDFDVGEAWDRAGVFSDQVSGAALTWRLPLVAESGLYRMVSAATELGVPIHLTRAALRRAPAIVPAGTAILVTENPRVVEAAADRSFPGSVITTNGNPSAGVRALLDQLLASGAVLRYHGDFDAPGLAICARMHSLGLQPWRMTANDYRTAVQSAETDGVVLPLETRQVGPTPWDPSLAAAMVDLQRIVHEERLLDDLLGGAPA